MNTPTPPNTSQDYDRHHQQNHIAKNPRTTKDASSINKDEIKKYAKEDKRNIAREDHTHFTTRHDTKPGGDKD